MSISSKNATNALEYFETPTTRLGKLILFVALEPPALLCNIILVYQLTTDRVLRRTLHLHVILALLIVSLLTDVIEVPRVISFLHLGHVLPSTITNCIIWQWCDFTLCSLNNLLMGWMSLERHLLVFHSHLFRRLKYRIFLHYLPIIMLVVYIAVFYAVTILLYPCTPKPDYLSVLCGLPCFSLEQVISTYDLFANNLIPLFLSIAMSIAIIFRVLHRKQAIMQQRVEWRKYRKMIWQLLILAILYTLTVVPYALIPFIGLFGGLPDVAAYIQTVYFYYLFWLLELLLPLVCIVCISEVRIKVIKQFLRWKNPGNIVSPLTATFIGHRTVNITASLYHR